MTLRRSTFPQSSSRLVAAVVCVVGCSGGAPRGEPIKNDRAGEARTRPTHDELSDAVHALAALSASRNDRAAALALLGTPFWFDGFSYGAPDDQELHARCARSGGTLFERAELEPFIDCIFAANWQYSDLANLAEVELADVPVVFSKHHARLADLASGRRFAFSHFCPAAPGDFWTLLAVGKDATGNVVVDAILVFNEDEGECREEDGRERERS